MPRHSHEFVLGYHLKAWLGVCASEMAHSPGCWQEALLPYHVDLSTDCLSFVTQNLAILRANDVKGNEQAGSRGAFQDVVFKMVAPSLLLYSVPYNWVPKSSSCSRGGKFISSDWRERVKKICRLWKIDTVSLLFLTIYVLLMCKRYSLPPKASTVSFHQSISSNSWILSK